MFVSTRQFSLTCAAYDSKHVTACKAAVPKHTLPALGASRDDLRAKKNLNPNFTHSPCCALYDRLAAMTLLRMLASVDTFQPCAGFSL